jgi:hypothetical protein
MTTNLVNGKKYIGRHSKEDANYLGSGRLLKQAIAKYGRENFSKQIIEECQTIEQLRECEYYWIAFHDAVNSSEFYNMSWKTGGFGVGDKHSLETRQFISEKCRGKKLTFDQRTKLAHASSVRVPWNKGQKVTFSNRKFSSRITLDEIRRIIDDFKTGEFTFHELSQKYSRRIKQFQIDRWLERLQKEG